MSLPKPDLHIRLSDKAMNELRFLAEVEGSEPGRVAARLLEQSLFGAGHAVKVAARRVLLAGNLAEEEGE